jgi:acetyltransferase-like isoleucine patch superfamily enzyme
MRSFIEDLIRSLSGSFGKKIRYWYYKKRLGRCGKNVFIDTGVYFLNCKQIFIGDNCWVDKNCILIAGKLEKSHIRKKETDGHNTSPLPGQLIIGKNAHIGIGTVIQAHGGVSIGDYFTSSAYCKIYSLSNDPYQSKQGTVGEDKNIYYIMTPVVVENNVWLGLNVSAIGCCIHSDVFVQPHSVVTGEIAPNSIAAGFPASAIRARFKS